MVFASRAHDDDIWLAGCEDVRAGAKSRITPCEGAQLLANCDVETAEFLIKSIMKILTA